MPTNQTSAREPRNHHRTPLSPRIVGRHIQLARHITRHVGRRPSFNALLVETRRHLSGPDFAYTLGCALDRATEVLMDGLRARVFVDTATAVNLPNTEEAQDVDAGARAENRDEVKIRLSWSM